MLKHFVLFLTTFGLLGAYANDSCAGEIKRKSLVVPKPTEEVKTSGPFEQTSSLHDEDKISLMERQIQSLLARIESLEHAVAKLGGAAAEGSMKPQQNAGVSSIGSAAAVASTTNVSQPALQDGDDEKQDYDAGLIALKNNDYEVAETKFAKFIEKYPKSSRLSNAYFWYGESFFRRSSFEKAAVNYLKGYKQFPKSDKASDSLLKLALSLGSMKKKREACAMLDKLDNEFKNRSAIAIKRAKDARNKYGCK